MRYGFFVAGVLAAGLSFVTVAQAADAPRIGVVNLQQVIGDSHRGQSANAEFNVLVQKIQNEAQDRRKKLAAMKKQLDATDSKSSDYVTLQKSLQDAAASYQQFASDSQQKIDQDKQQLLQPIEDELKKVLLAYARDNHYDILLNKNNDGAVYAGDKYDVTTEITEALDKDWAEMQKTQPKPAAKGK